MEKLNWISAYIDKTLEGITYSSYRKRAEAELTEHLTESYKNLIEQGLSPESAKNEALYSMGNIEEIKKEHKFACNFIKSSSFLYYLRSLMIGCFLIGVFYIITFYTLASVGFTYDSQPGILIIGSAKATKLFGIFMFIIPFSIGTVYFRKAFKYRISKAMSIVSALLFTSTCEKIAILVISSFVYDTKIWQLRELLYRVSIGGDQTAPWFTLNYILFTFAGCTILGFISRCDNLILNYTKY